MTRLFPDAFYRPAADSLEIVDRNGIPATWANGSQTAAQNPGGQNPEDNARIQEHMRQVRFRQHIEGNPYDPPQVVTPRTADDRAIHRMTIDLRFPYEDASGEMPSGDEDFFKLPQVEWFLRVLVQDGRSFTGRGEWEALITSMYASRNRPGNIAGISALYTYSQYMDCHSFRFSVDRDIRRSTLVVRAEYQGKERPDAILSAPAKVLIPSETVEAKPRRMNMRKGLRGTPE